jgi:hypothetical protein
MNQGKETNEEMGENGLLSEKEKIENGEIIPLRDAMDMVYDIPKIPEELYPADLQIKKKKKEISENHSNTFNPFNEPHDSHSDFSNNNSVGKEQSDIKYTFVN